MSKKYVYMFAEGNANMRELLGGKGANLAEMASLGLPVPYGFTITTEACNAYYDDGKKINKDIMAQIKKALTKLEKQAGRNRHSHRGNGAPRPGLWRGRGADAVPLRL